MFRIINWYLYRSKTWHEIFCYCSYIRTAQLITGAAGSGSSGSSSVYCWVFIAEEVDEIAEEDRRYHNSWCTDILVSPFYLLDLPIPLMMTFSGLKKQNLRSCDYAPQVPDYQYFRIIGCWIKGILLYFIQFRKSNLIYNNSMPTVDFKVPQLYNFLHFCQLWNVVLLCVQDERCCWLPKKSTFIVTIKSSFLA